MTKRNNVRTKITLHLNYYENYCTLYTTKGSNPVNVSYVVDSNLELSFLTQFATFKNKIIIPNESTKFVLDKMLALLLSKKFAVLIDPQIIDIQSEMDKKMNDYNKTPVEIILGNKVSKGMPIPAPSERKFNPTPRAVFFCQEAKRYKYKTSEYAEFCDMSNYYGLYDTMNDDQKNWYFYWRAKARKGEYMPTAITYINIYLYELINCVGVSDERDAMDKISALWLNYREEYPLLDGYVGRWLMDFSIIYNVSGVEDTFNKIDFEWKSNEIDILLSTMENKIDLLGRFNVINYYSTYKITKSSFYTKCDDKETIKKKIETAFAAVEEYFINKYFYSICDKYSPYYSTRTVQAPFAGALYAGFKMIDIKYKSYNGNPEFKNFVAQIVKYTEKILRQQYKFRSPLQKIELSDNIKSIIDTVIKIPETAQAQKPKQGPIVVDMEKINILIKDSDEMQKLLIESSDDETPPAPTVTQKPEPPVSASCDDTVDELFSRLSACQLDVMKILSDGKDFNRINEIAVLNNTIPSKILDDINELAMETINDIIIDTTSGVIEIIEQYAADCAKCLNK